MGWSCEPTKAHHSEEPMEEYRSLSHTKWQCKYHIVFIPKYRRRTLFGEAEDRRLDQLELPIAENQ